MMSKATGRPPTVDTDPSDAPEALDRRLGDKIEGAVRQAIAFGRDELAERLGVCHLTLLEEDRKDIRARRAED